MYIPGMIIVAQLLFLGAQVAFHKADKDRAAEVCTLTNLALCGLNILVFIPASIISN